MHILTFIIYAPYFKQRREWEKKGEGENRRKGGKGAWRRRKKKIRRIKDGAKARGKDYFTIYVEIFLTLFSGSNTISRFYFMWSSGNFFIVFSSMKQNCEAMNGKLKEIENYREEWVDGQLQKE